MPLTTGKLTDQLPDPRFVFDPMIFPFAMNVIWPELVIFVVLKNTVKVVPERLSEVILTDGLFVHKQFICAAALFGALVQASTPE